MTTATSWRMRGHILENCSCNVACPCNFGGDPTLGYCEATLGFEIQEGNYGGTQLGGLNLALYVRMPGKPFDGNWTLGVYLDQRATQEAGGGPGNHPLRTGRRHVRRPERPDRKRPAAQAGAHHLRDRGWRAPGHGPRATGGRGSERIPNPMAGQPPLDTKVTNIALPLYSGPANVRRSSVFSLTDPDLSFQHSGSSSFTGHFDYTGP